MCFGHLSAHPLTLLAPIISEEWWTGFFFSFWSTCVTHVPVTSPRILTAVWGKAARVRWFVRLGSLLLWSIILVTVIISPPRSLIILSRLISSVWPQMQMWLSSGGGGDGGLINALPLSVRLLATHKSQNSKRSVIRNSSKRQTREVLGSHIDTFLWWAKVSEQVLLRNDPLVDPSAEPPAQLPFSWKILI